MKIRKIICVIAGLVVIAGSVFAEEKKTSVEVSFSINWNFGCYKETTFSNISESIVSPRFQLDTKIYSNKLLHKITADYCFSNPQSEMTQAALVYKNYDPVTGESYYEGFKSNLSFHRIRLQYDAAYDVYQNGKFELYVGGNFSCNAYLQFEHYPSITGLVSVGPSTVLKYNLNDNNTLLLTGSMPLLGYGVRPSYAGCDAKLMKYAEEDFMKLLTLGDFLSLHNYQSLMLDFEYKLKATQRFALGLGFNFEYSRIAVPEERPLYYLDGSIKTMASITF